MGVAGHVAEADIRADSWDANMGVAEDILKFRPNRADNLDVNVDVDVPVTVAVNVTVARVVVVIVVVVAAAGAAVVVVG